MYKYLGGVCFLQISAPSSVHCRHVTLKLNSAAVGYVSCTLLLHTQSTIGMSPLSRPAPTFFGGAGNAKPEGNFIRRGIAPPGPTLSQSKRRRAGRFR